MDYSKTIKEVLADCHGMITKYQIDKIQSFADQKEWVQALGNLCIYLKEYNRIPSPSTIDKIENMANELEVIVPEIPSFRNPKQYDFNIEKIIKDHIGRICFSLEEIVSFAEEGHGFGIDGGYFDITYPADLDEYDIYVDGCEEIPEGMVELTFWYDGYREFRIPLIKYLSYVREYLLMASQIELAERVEILIEKTTS